MKKLLLLILLVSLFANPLIAKKAKTPTPTPSPSPQVVETVSEKETAKPLTETEPQTQTAEPVPNKIPRWVVRAESGSPISNRATLPKGYEPKHLNSPFGVDGRFHLFLGRSEKKIARLIFDANMGTTVTRLLAFGGAGFGSGFKIKDFDIQATFGVQLQSLLTGYPYENSMINADWAYVRAYGVYTNRYVQPFVEIEGMKVLMSKLITLEGTETHVTHNMHLKFGTGTELTLPFGFFVKGQAEVFFLEKVGIASKDFATTLDPHEVYRFSASAGKYISSFKASAIYRTTTHAADEDALYYQAPFLYRNNILIPQYLGLEVQWKY